LSAASSIINGHRNVRVTLNVSL